MMWMIYFTQLSPKNKRLYSGRSGMSEFDDFTVYRDTRVGWCANTPINETMDADGNPSIQATGFPASDPRAPSMRVYDHPEVNQLRDELRAHNGICGLDVCQPNELDRIDRVFRRDGFVVVTGLLDDDALSRWREGCARVLQDLLSIPGSDGRKYLTETERLPHRYSFGTASASRQMLHDPVWASMIDLPATTPILIRLFGGENYDVMGAGGDLCLPGAVEYQTLHADLQEGYQLPPPRIEQARRQGLEVEDGDQRAGHKVVAYTPPLITINFLMSDLTWENGPIRQIPGTHWSLEPPPSQAEEPAWMRFSTLVGAPAGAGVFRDNRAWHGATPNLSRQVRALPNVEYGAPWIAGRRAKTMPYEVWEGLSPHARAVAESVRAEPGVWPEGAGKMHPLLAGRRAANESSPGIARAE
jgi:hypothetical protein